MITTAAGRRLPDGGRRCRMRGTLTGPSWHADSRRTSSREREKIMAAYTFTLPEGAGASGAVVTVTQSGDPDGPPAAIYSDSGLTTRIANGQVTASGSGVITWFAASGQTGYVARYTISGAARMTRLDPDVQATPGKGFAPAAVVQAGAGTGATAAVSGQDSAAVITVTSGSASLAAGALVVVTFAVPFKGGVPEILLTPGSDAAAATAPFVTARSATGFTISTHTAPGATQSLVYEYEARVR